MRWLLGAFVTMTMIAVYFWRDPPIPVPDLPTIVISSEVTVTEVALSQTGAIPLPLTIVGRPLPKPDNPQGFAHLWPAIYATAAFNGPDVIIAFDDPINRYAVRLDDRPIMTLNRPGQSAYKISGLSAGKHMLRIEKISESFQADGGVQGIYVPDPTQVLPAPAPKPYQIAFIGDSDTVGLGNLSMTRECSSTAIFAWTDTSQSFGPIVAAHFDADYTMTARSGIGLVRNYDDVGPGTEMALEYVPLPGAALDVVVIALGSNDFATPISPDGRWADIGALKQDFTQTYLKFLDRLHSTYPDAYFAIVTIDNYGQDYLASHTAVIAGLTPGLAERTTHIPVPKITQAGCNWHPSLHDHKVIADVVTNALRDANAFSAR